MIKQFKIKITGTNAIVLHSDRAVDPFSPYKSAMKALTSIRKKTDDDLAMISRLEFESALYVQDGVIAIPVKMLQESIRCGAALNKNGKKIERGVEVLGTLDTGLNYSALDYSNAGKIIKNLPDPNELKDDEIPCANFEKLYKPTFMDGRCVVVTRARIWKVRPKFPSGWSSVFTISYDETIIDEKDLMLSIQNAGTLMGIGSMRKLRMGRFTYEIVK